RAHLFPGSGDSRTKTGRRRGRRGNCREHWPADAQSKKCRKSPLIEGELWPTNGLVRSHRGGKRMGNARQASGGGGPSAEALYYAKRTVVFADVVESVKLMQRDELAAAARIRDLLLEAANEIIPRYRGRLLQRLGDGLMMAFAHPCDATECARALHSRAAEFAKQVAVADRVLLRIGIHSAD